MKFNDEQEQIAKQISVQITTLNELMKKAIATQIYARKNPDGVVDEMMLNDMGYSVDELMGQFETVEEKRDDILAVRAGTMSVEKLETKYT